MFKTLRRVINLYGVHKKRIYLGLVCSSLNAVFSSFTIMAFLWVLLHIQNLTMTIIWQTVAILAVTVIGKTVLKFLMNMFLLASGYIVFTDKRLELGDKLKTAPMGYFSKESLGRINNTITTSMATLEGFAPMAIETVVGGILQALAVCIFLMFFNWKLGLIATAGVLVSMLFLKKIQKNGEELAPKRYATVEKVTNDVLEFIRGIAVIRSFGRNSSSDLDDSFEDYRKMNTTLEKKTLVPMGFFRATLEIFSGIVALAAALMTYFGQLEFSYGVMFILSSFIIYGQMEMLATGAFLLEQIEASLDNMNETYAVPVLKGNGEKVPEDFTIEVKDVHFGYDKKPVLQGISAKIPQKSTCAIVGYSGSGKTTLCNLIVRFWDVNSGSITFGGTDIRKLNPDELLSHFSMVFQNVFLFNDTIENNIKFGMQNATHEQVVEAAKRARCHEFIEALPDGYNTIVGEGGNSLSGGEKQRISIARALLKNAPVVILDEATSSLDPENEAELLEAIDELTRGKTVISIAHRLNTVRKADQILVLDQGKIVQSGKHAELCNVDGIYKRFLDIRRSSAGWNIS
ncbi:MAG: ABC transporter ATP-binding protein/permease [Fibrobacter sp.]|nr:ABC transporter ATP-binding protein/permease [Fibrobacter sp.]